MSELVVRKRDLTAQEYYEIYLKSKQEGDDRKKSSQCLLARGGSFRIKPEEKAHAALSRSKSLKIVRTNHSSSSEGPVLTKIIKRDCEVSEVDDDSSDEDSGSAKTSRSGTFGNISSLVSVTERVKQLNSAMSSRQVRTRNHNAPAFFTAKDMIKAETHAENVTLETFGDHAGTQSVFSFSRKTANFNHQESLLPELVSNRVENEKVAFPASEYNLIIPCADSLALVHLRKSGPRPHLRKYKGSLNPLKKLLSRTDIKYHEDPPKFDASSSEGCPLKRLSTEDVDIKDTSSIRNVLLHFCDRKKFLLADPENEDQRDVLRHK